MNKENKNIIYNISTNKSINFLRFKEYYLERDVFNIISIIFNTEAAVRLNHNVEEVEIEITKESFEKWNIAEIESNLEKILKLVLYKRIKIKLIEKDINSRRTSTDIKFDKVGNICLYSGGIDSTTGIILLSEKLKRDVRGVFVCHGDQGKIGNVVSRVNEMSISKKIDFKFDIMHAPKMYREGYSQLRGLLYVLFAGIQANLRDAKKIFVTECGTTMYQIRYSPYDSVTMTTHPSVMKFAKKLIDLFFNKDIKLILPFEDLTKAEITILNPIPEVFKKSHSCIGSAWINSKKRKDNCGLCYGCIIRRLGLITAGVVDTEYEKNPITENIGSIHLMNVLSLSTEILLDYESVDDYIKDIILDYNKDDLFKRFAVDNISALHVLIREKKRLNDNIKFFYEQVVEKLGTKFLDERITEIRNKRKEPNYDKSVE